ncbi:hypothetical protein [Paraburkholderia sp. J76]|uniref:hypothetical protein n=1 Tax=Paraburkholderia sp. J76 TaxID=2805439 RepID=UPI002ABE19E4|nr:hypothetical protein [Paraburkholderia sp. J76]
MSEVSKRDRLAGELGCFVQKYARKARPGGLDPNDRKYDHKIEKAMRRLRPDELSDLLSGDSEPDAAD